MNILESQLSTMTFDLSSEADLPKVLDHVIGLLEEKAQHAELHPAHTQGTIIALSGDLGAGKTTFTKLLAAKLGVTETITSPTFVILKKYKISYPSLDEVFTNLVHIDAYRLEGADALKKLSFESFYDNPTEKNIICIEWPEIVPEVIPSNAISIRFEHQEGTGRKVTVSSIL